MAELKVEYRYNPRTGVVHQVAKGDDSRAAFSAEACNLDDAEESVEINEDEMQAYLERRPEKRCGHCWNVLP